jgi:hypothetical protein
VNRLSDPALVTQQVGNMRLQMVTNLADSFDQALLSGISEGRLMILVLRSPENSLVNQKGKNSRDLKIQGYSGQMRRADIVGQITLCIQTRSQSHPSEDRGDLPLNQVDPWKHVSRSIRVKPIEPLIQDDLLEAMSRKSWKFKVAALRPRLV